MSRPQEAQAARPALHAALTTTRRTLRGRSHPSQALSGALPDLFALLQLQALQLQGNRLTGPLPRLPPAIRHVDLEGNHLR